MQYLPSREAAKILGLHPHTLRRYADTGIIPYIKTQSGQRRYDVQTYLGNSKPTTTICYCRVSSHKQSGDLQRQVAFMQQQYPNAEIITDVASGLNYRRKGLAAILERIHQGDKLTLVVAYRDRLARFGTELIEQMLQQNGGELLVLNQRELSPPEELTHRRLQNSPAGTCGVDQPERRTVTSPTPAQRSCTERTLMALTAELGQKVEAIYREHLEKEFPATVKFDTIRVEPAEDSEGRDTFRVTVVYDDGHERPNPKTRGTVLASLMDPLENLGVPPVLIESYVPLSEYPILLDLRAEPPWGVDEE